MMNIKTKILTFILTVILVISVTGASYAYFSSNISKNLTSGIIADTGNINVSYDNGSSSINVSDIKPSEKPFVVKVFSVAGTTDSKMPYTLSLNIDYNTFNLGELKYTLESVNLANNGVVIDDIKNYTNISGTNTNFGTGYFEKADSSVHSYILKIYYLKEIKKNTNKLAKKFVAHIGIVVNKNYSYMAHELISKVGATTNGGLKSISQMTTSQTSGTTEYRYYGANPENYVQFNNELWRIIGVFETIDDKDIKDYRVKIIRNESIGNYALDSSESYIDDGDGNNDWSSSDLIRLLNPKYDNNSKTNNTGATLIVNNSLYYNRSKGSCIIGQNNLNASCDFSSTGLTEEAKKMIKSAVYYTNSANTNLFKSQLLYSSERSSGKDNGREISTTNYVGLMYASDYGYATNFDMCDNKLLNEYADPSCYLNDWLYLTGKDELTMTPIDDSKSMLVVSSKGILEEGKCSNNYIIRPVVYLDTNVKIKSGDGSQNNPYQLSL